MSNTQIKIRYDGAIANARKNEGISLGSSGWTNPVTIDRGTRDAYEQTPPQSYLITATGQVEQRYKNAVSNALNQGKETCCESSSDWYMDSSGNIKTQLPEMPSESFLITESSLEKIVN